MNEPQRSTCGRLQRAPAAPARGFGYAVVVVVRHNFTNVIVLPDDLKASPSRKSLQNVSINFPHLHEEMLEEGERRNCVAFRNTNFSELRHSVIGWPRNTYS